MLRAMSTVFALTMMLAASPAFAQGASGDGSDLSACRNRIEQGRLLTQSLTDETKKAAATKQVELAQQALAGGNATECLVQLDQLDRILR